MALVLISPISAGGWFADAAKRDWDGTSPLVPTVGDFRTVLGAESRDIQVRD